MDLCIPHNPALTKNTCPDFYEDLKKIFTDQECLTFMLEFLIQEYAKNECINDVKFLLSKGVSRMSIYNTPMYTEIINLRTACCLLMIKYQNMYLFDKNVIPLIYWF
jgi:hypothetical protein